MGFVPQSGEHALVEVVFGFRVGRSFTPKEISIFKSAHGQWKEFLPRVNDLGINEIAFGPNGIQSPKIIPRAGVVFERMKPDGTIAWRCTFEGNSIFVNCLEYDSWDEVSPKVLEIVSTALNLLEDQSLRVVNISYQAVDLFRWNGDPKEYSIRELLDVDGECVPRRMRDVGLNWHLHQGWFEDGEALTGVPGQLLNRIHFDATERNQNDAEPEVRVDATLQQNLIAPFIISEVGMEGAGAQAIFDALHEKNKDVMRQFLTSDMSKLIGLGE